jgi:uncharacterized protein (TIGR03437 family)
VTFNGVPAPLTYVSATQINCVVPYEVAGSATAQVQISYNGLTSTNIAQNVIATAPGLFTQNASGTGLGAILNSNYQLVNAGNPAPRGSIIILYGTGEGLTTPAGVTGTVAGTALKNPVAPVSVSIGGQTATVLYSGSAPGLVSGVLQINAMVPAGIAAGNQPVLVTIGTQTSQSNVLVALQ